MGCNSRTRVSENSILNETKKLISFASPKHYADWFDFFENIDLRVYLRDVEWFLLSQL